MRWVRASIVVALLATPVVLAFFSGGYFDRPRLWAGVVAWIAVGGAAVACRQPWPRTPAAWLAVGALAGLTAWTAASINWAPLGDAAQADAQRLLLYLGVLIAGVAVFSSRAAARTAEPILALGALLAVGEGLSERLLPGLFELDVSETGTARLFQPVTYWNAMGLLAALGLVLCVRVAGDSSRPRWMRVGSAAAGPWLAAGGYLTLSRGAILAVVVGFALLAALRPTAAQLRAIGVICVASVVAVAAGALLPAVRTLEGSPTARESQGLVMLAVLALSALVAGVAVARDARRPRDAGLEDEPSRSALRATRAVAAIVAVGVIGVFALVIGDEPEVAVIPEATEETSRLVSSEAIRGNFWRVASGAFAAKPLRGVGSGGFAVEWLRERTVLYAARDAHSLYLETAAELGLVGLALLAAFLAGIIACAVRAYSQDPELTTGPIAGAGLWAVHAGIDWDWEMPAVTLIALVLAAVLVARRDELSPERRVDAALPDPARERQPAGAAVVL